MSGYETYLDAVIDALEDAVEACSSFNSSSVHFDYFRTEDYGNYDPICLLSLQRDSIAAIGAKETEHILTFQVWVKHTGTGTKENLSEIISYVGEIIDYIEAHRKLGISTYIEKTEVTNVEYSMSAPPSGVIYSAVLTVEVQIIRNV